MTTGPDRRAFLKGAARWAGVGLAAPYVLTSGALGQGTRPAASDQVAVGHVGVGGMGGGHLRRMVSRPEGRPVAVCDVDRGRLARAHRMTGGRARTYSDYRRLLEAQDIDAVVCATPDHWHPLVTIHACEAGKDVYCEKPLSVTVVEGRAMVTAARRYARVVQLGTQWRSMAGRNVAQYIRNGYCGRVREVRCWHYPNPAHPPAAPMSVPPGLDWDRWLGPLAWMPYHPRRCFGSFRWFMWSGGGNIRDRGAHIFGVVSWAMDVDHTGPEWVEATGTRHPGLYDNPITMSAAYQFRNPDWVLRWDQPGQPRGGQYGAYFVGDRDTLAFWGNFNTEREALFEPAAHEVALPRSRNHMGNFLGCVRTRQRPIMDVAIGHRVTTLCILGNLAFQLGRRLRWDAAAERFIGDDEANRLLHYAYRSPWQL